MKRKITYIGIGIFILTLAIILTSKNKNPLSKINAQGSTSSTTLSMTIYLDPNVRDHETYTDEVVSYLQDRLHVFSNIMLDAVGSNYNIDQPSIIPMNNFEEPLDYSNYDRFINKMDGNGYYNSRSDIVVYAFVDADFLRYANAMAFPFRNQHIIIADAVMIQAPHIFLHELMHTFDIPHSNARYVCSSSNENMFNLMNAMTIGCAPLIDENQIGVMNENYAILSMDPAIINPDTTRLCCNVYFRSARDTTRNGDYNVIDKVWYEDDEVMVNSIDGNYVGTPHLNSDSNQVKYLLELYNDMDPGLAVNIGGNYQNFANHYGINNPIIFAEKMLRVHDRMRENNILRWMLNDVRRAGLTDSISFTYSSREQDNYKTLMDEMCYYNLIKCTGGCSNCN